MPCCLGVEPNTTIRCPMCGVVYGGISQVVRGMFGMVCAIAESVPSHSAARPGFRGG